MRFRLIYLIAGISILFTLTQCKDSVTQTTEPDPNPNTKSGLAQPSLIAPEIHSEQATSTTLEWKEIAGVELFQVQMAMDENFDSTTVDSVVESNAFILEDLPGDTTLHWQVRSVNEEETGPWSETWNFKTNPKSSKPISTDLKSPDNGAEVPPNSIELKWQEVSNASGYNLQLAEDRKFESLVSDKEIAETSYEISDLDDSKSYYWRIEPIVQEEKTKWSKTYEFITNSNAEATPKATLVSPEDNATDQSTTLGLEWEEISGIDSYQVQLATSDAFSSPEIDETVDNNSYEVSDLDNDQTYYWRVQASGDEDAENWSETYEFTTETEAVPPVTLISPENNATDQSTTLNLEWEAISGIESYQVQLATSDAFSSPEVDETVNNTSHEVSNLDNDQTYYWRVQAEGDGDSENWSSVHTFNTESESIDDGGDTPNSVEGDRQALMDLYEATNGDSWNNNSGWGNGDPSGSWHGIETDAEGRVTRVDLFDNGLSGQLPESIGNLSKVKYLNVKKNELTGEIPSSIGNMASLEWLILSGRTYEIGGTLKEPPENLNYAYHPGKKRSATNSLNGTIPSTIGNLSNLLFLEISDQPNIKGPIPSELGNLSKLKGLYLNLNDFSGYGIPSSLGNLTNLKHLYMAAAQLEGEFPASLKNLTGLTNLNLGKPKNTLPANNLSGDLPDFSGFTELRSIILTNNNFDGEYPSYWNNGNFTQLNTLRIAWNNLTGTLHGFDNLPALENFGVEGNRLSGTIEEQLTELPDRLQILGLGWNNFTGNLPQDGWADFYKLKTLYLNDNNLSGEIPCDFWEKVDNPKLGISWLSNNDFESNCTSSMERVEGNGNPDISVSGNNFIDILHSNNYLKILLDYWKALFFLLF